MTALEKKMKSKYALVLVCSALVQSVSAQTMKTITLEPGDKFINQKVNLAIDFTTDKKPWCGLRVFWGDEKSQPVRVGYDGDEGAPSSPIQLSYSYKTAGKYNVTLKGELLVRGLLGTATPCDVKTKTLEVVVIDPENDAKYIEKTWANYLGSLPPVKLQCMQVGLPLLDVKYEVTTEADKLTSMNAPSSKRVMDQCQVFAKAVQPKPNIACKIKGSTGPQDSICDQSYAQKMDDGNLTPITVEDAVKLQFQSKPWTLTQTETQAGKEARLASEISIREKEKKLASSASNADSDKTALASQLEKMQLMLTQLEKANAAGVRVAEGAPAPAAVKRATPQVSANRKALVIGNDRYTDVTPLNNAGADAEAMALGLTQAGYKVTKLLNLNLKGFNGALREFGKQVANGDEVLFFYAGHGVQLGNANYLLPTDIKGESPEEVKDDAILLQRFLDDMQDKKAKFTLAVVDACRDNPFSGPGTRSVGTRGLAPTNPATGQMVMYSAGAGQRAIDKLGKDDLEKNGLFTRTFVKEMLKPGISVDRVLRNVRDEVVEKAKSVGLEQNPALYDQSVGDFYFVN